MELHSPFLLLSTRDSLLPTQFLLSTIYCLLSTWYCYLLDYCCYWLILVHDLNWWSSGGNSLHLPFLLCLELVFCCRASLLIVIVIVSAILPLIVIGHWPLPLPLRLRLRRFRFRFVLVVICRNQPSVESSGRRTSSREARRAQLRTDAGRAACPFSAIHPDGGLTTAVPSLERGEGRHVRRIGRHIALLRIRIRAGRETRGRGNLPPVSR